MVAGSSTVGIFKCWNVIIIYALLAVYITVHLTTNSLGPDEETSSCKSSLSCSAERRARSAAAKLYISNKNTSGGSHNINSISVETSTTIATYLQYD